MTFRKSCFCLLLLVVAPVVSSEVNAQNDRAGVTHAVTRAVEEVRQAGVPDETVSRLLSLGYDNGVEAVSMASLVGIVGTAKKENLPLEPFVSKIEEGMAKGVPAAAIEQVLNQKKQDYLFIRSVTADYLKKYGINQQVTPDDLAGIAENLYSGLSRQELVSTMEQAPAVSLFTLKRVISVQASLKRAGFDPKLSDRIVSTALEHNFFARQRRGFIRAVVAGKRKGVSDEKITEAALSTIRSGGTVAGFCSQIGVSSYDM
jgi:hypothetical protein